MSADTDRISAQLMTKYNSAAQFEFRLNQQETWQVGQKEICLILSIYLLLSFKKQKLGACVRQVERVEMWMVVRWWWCNQNPHPPSGPAPHPLGEERNERRVTDAELLRREHLQTLRRNRICFSARRGSGASEDQHSRFSSLIYWSIRLSRSKLFFVRSTLHYEALWNELKCPFKHARLDKCRSSSSLCNLGTQRAASRMHSTAGTVNGGAWKQWILWTLTLLVPPVPFYTYLSVSFPLASSVHLFCFLLVFFFAALPVFPELRPGLLACFVWFCFSLIFWIAPVYFCQFLLSAFDFFFFFWDFNLHSLLKLPFVLSSICLGVLHLG